MWPMTGAVSQLLYGLLPHRQVESISCKGQGRSTKGFKRSWNVWPPSLQADKIYIFRGDRVNKRSRMVAECMPSFHMDR